MLAAVKMGKMISHDNLARFSEYFSKMEHRLWAAATLS